MKIFAFIPPRDCGEHSELNGYCNESKWLVWPDSCMLISNRPLYIPDFDSTFFCVPAAAFKICRLGKGIAPKFALRYVGHFSASAIILPRRAFHALLAGETPDVDCVCFDNAVLAGSWLSLNLPQSKLAAADASEALSKGLPEKLRLMVETLGKISPKSQSFESDSGNIPLPEENVNCHDINADVNADINWDIKINANILPQLVASISERNTLKTGDMILLPDFAKAFPLRRDTRLLITLDAKASGNENINLSAEQNTLLLTKIK